PSHGVQGGTFPQGDPIRCRIQFRLQFRKNGPVLEHLQIRRNDEVREHRVRPGQILRHVLRVSQTEKTDLQFNPFPAQPPGQLLQKRLFLAVQDADVVPIKQDVCH
ncbi:Relaxasome subunit MobC, partial [Dysosmobacter welbionis]